METTGPVLTSNLFLDRSGEVVLALDSDGLTWEPVESQELSTSCLRFTFNTNTETEIKYSDIYAVESINWGSIHELIPNTGGLLSYSHCEMYRFVVHGFWRSRSQQSVWVLAEYTFGHKDLCTCQLLVNQINDHISKDVARPKSLLVFVHPLSGKKTGRKTWESVRPIFSRANVKTKVIVTEKAGHARDFIKSITDYELNSFDGVLAVGGDGFFNEILNGLLASRHSAGYPFSPHEFMHSVGKKDRNPQFETNKSSNIEKNDDDLNAEFPASPERDEDEPLLTSSETTMPGFSFVGKENGSCNTDAGQDFTFSFPNNWFRLGIIPAGSTDSIVLSTTGARDPVTSALHVILGKRTRLDIVQIVRWNSELSSADVHSVRYAASFAGYGFYGDVIKESEKYRWMGPKRYDYAGTKVFLRHRSYEADVVFLEHKKPSTISGRGSEGTCIPQEMVCRVNCVTCNEPLTNPAITPANKRDMNSSLPPEKSNWVTCKGRFQSVGAAIISCRNERAPDGLVANAHLADGYMHLILVKECPRPLYLWHLTQLTRRGAEPLKFEFIEHHQTQAFTFTTSNDESVWNLDGELFQARQLSAQVFRGLVSLFAAGPEV